MAVSKPAQAPKLFAWTTKRGVPIFSLLLTSSISALCFGSSFVGSGELWGWLQNIVGVSNQVKDLLFVACIFIVIDRLRGFPLV